jgi:hypothetical protein
MTKGNIGMTTGKRKTRVTRILAAQDPLLVENRALRERIDDLAAQLAERNASRLIAPYEEEAIKAQAQQFREMNEQFNAIGLFLRNNYAEEIARGEHNDASISQVVMKYLRRERAATRRKPGFIERLFGGGVQ